MSRSLVLRAEPCATIAIPPTTTKSTPWATRRFSSRPGWNSGQLATTPRACECDLADVGVASLEALDPVARREPQPSSYQRLVDARVVRLGVEREPSPAGAERAVERVDPRVRMTALEPSDR